MFSERVKGSVQLQFFTESRRSFYFPGLSVES